MANFDEIVKLKIITTSDVHGTIFQYDFIEDEMTTSSLSQIYTYIKEQRQQKDQEVILLDNGDILQGQPVVFYSNKLVKENPNYKHVCSEVMNFMEYDAATLGNHDIEAGHEVYDRLKPEFNFPWMAANAICKKTGEPYFEPYTIIKRKGVKIAILGLLTPAIPMWAPQNKWEGIDFEDMIITARKWVQHIKEVEKPDLMIGLFHSGIDYNYNRQNADTYKNENASILVAQRVPGIDVVFAGHDHQEYNLKVENVEGQKVLILNPQSHANFVSIVDIKMMYNAECNKYEKYDITGYNLQMDFCDADREFKNKFKDYVAEVKKIVSEPIGSFNRSVSSRESMFADTGFVDMIHRVQLEFTKADISFAAPLSYDVVIRKGNVFIRDMFKLYKFDNILYKLTLRGDEIKKYLEFSYAIWFNRMRSPDDTLLNFRYNHQGEMIMAEKYYNFSSAAGIIYNVNLKTPLGYRINIISMANGEPFDYHKEYTVVMNSYRGNGGGGHLIDGVGIQHAEIQKRIIWHSDQDVRSIIIDWIRNQKQVEVYALGQWRAIPKNWWHQGRLISMKVLFENKKTD